MNEEKAKQANKKRVRVSRECAYLAVFVALVIAAQLCLTFVPGIELVTVLFVSYAFAFGWRRGALAAVAFSLLRQLIFGFFPTVLILYLLYYSLLALFFGLLGGRVKKTLRSLWWLVPLACFCSVCFTLTDCVLTPLWYGYSERAARAYFFSSLSFMFSQVVCTALTVGLLFVPLVGVFQYVKKSLRKA